MLKKYFIATVAMLIVFCCCSETASAAPAYAVTEEEVEGEMLDPSLFNSCSVCNAIHSDSDTPHLVGAAMIENGTEYRFVNGKWYRWHKNLQLLASLLRN